MSIAGKIYHRPPVVRPPRDIPEVSMNEVGRNPYQNDCRKGWRRKHPLDTTPPPPPPPPTSIKKSAAPPTKIATSPFDRKHSIWSAPPWVFGLRGVDRYRGGGVRPAASQPTAGDPPAHQFRESDSGGLVEARIPPPPNIHNHPTRHGIRNEMCFDHRSCCFYCVLRLFFCPEY